MNSELFGLDFKGYRNEYIIVSSWGYIIDYKEMIDWCIIVELERVNKKERFIKGVKDKKGGCFLIVFEIII